MTSKNTEKVAFWRRLRRRGVLRVALSYLLIGWLLLQIGDVVLDPLGAPDWVMQLLIFATVAGFPVALILAWFLEFTPTGIEVDHLEETVERPTVRGLRHYADIVIIVGLLFVVAFLLYRQQSMTPVTTETPVVAVLPFEELDNSEDNHFGDGFADTLIQKLGMLDQAVVLAPTSTFEFRDAGLDPTQVAASLGANLLLKGNMRRAGGLLRLEASLLKGASGQKVWSGNFRRPIEDIFRVQDEIVNAMVTAMGVQLTVSQVERIAKPPTTSLAAYDVYIKASTEALESRDAERIPEALQYLYDAIELDPEFALAYAKLVEAMHLSASYRFWDTNWSDIADEARSAATRAQELDPTLGEGYLAEAFVAEWENDSGIQVHPKDHLIKLTEKALELSPNNTSALKMLGSLSTDPDRKLELLTRAARIDPRSGIIRVNIAERYVAAGNYNQAEQWLIRAAKATDPYFSLAYKMLIRMNAWDAARLDRAARWGRACEIAYPQDWNITLAFTRTLLELGAWGEANGLLDRAMALAESGDLYMSWIYTHKGQWLAYLEGDRERAVELAERYIREHLRTLTDWPDLSGQPPVMMRPFELLALADLSEGNAQAALERYTDARLNPEKMSLDYHDGPAITPAVMYAILHRYAGEPEASERLLRSLLPRIAQQNSENIRETGFAEFTVYAFLGETDKAIQALQAKVDEGWLLGWWSLEFGAFDPNYAAVLEDPRYKRLFNQIVSRVTEMRESFRANPDLPQELLQEAGLLAL
ncbi:MAG TPA: hypothetical protein VKN35_14215 [Xanthomonadales bacterium]|nr:hypothetical protein [Xanthomonadales bacterium]